MNLLVGRNVKLKSPLNMNPDTVYKVMAMGVSYEELRQDTIGHYSTLVLQTPEGTLIEVAPCGVVLTLEKFSGKNSLME